MENIYVTKPSMPPMQEYYDEVAGLWETGILTHSGAKHQQFERMLCDFMGVENVSLFTNGHQGLEAIFNSLGARGEVITTPFTRTWSAYSTICALRISGAARPYRS